MSHELNDLRLLVLEDEVLIGLDLEDTLALAGAKEVVLVENLEKARAHLAQHGAPDVALLDALVSDGRTFDLARDLLRLGAKVIFVTGYRQGIAGDLVHCLVVEKPFTPQDLIQAVLAAVARPGEPPLSALK